MGKRITSVVLAIVMTLSTLTGLAGCGKKSSDEWSITEDDLQSAAFIDMSLAKGEAGAVTLTATNSEEIFKSDLKDSYFYIVPLVDNQTDEASAETETASETSTMETITDKVLSEKALKNVTYKRVDGETLTFSFTDATENVIGYTAYIHKNALTTGTYGLALGVEDGSLEDTVVATASVSETFNTATVNPTITVKLENTDTAEGFTKEMITLGNAFEDLTITNVSGQGGTILISTSGRVKAEDSLTGTVQFTETATTSGKALYASAPVDFVTAYIDDSTLNYAAGKLIFNVCLASDTFKSESGITIDGMTVTVDSLCEDKKTATVSVAVSSTDVDTAIDALKGKDITIAANAVAAGEEYVIPFSVTKVGLGTMIDFITKNENSTSFAVEAFLIAKNGTFAALSASDITLAGDFAGATDVKLEKVSDTEYSLKFNFVPAGTVNEEAFSFSGTVTVAAGKLNNNWNTATKQTLSATATYDSESDRFGIMNVVATVKTAVNMVRAFTDTHSSVINTVKAVGKGAASAAGGIKSVLGVLGIIPTTDSKLEEIQSTLYEIQDTLAQIDNSVAQVNNAVNAIGVAIEEVNYQQQKLSAQAEWNRFVDTMTDMNGYIDSFQIEYYAQLKAIVSRKNTTLTIYKDEDGVTLPLNMDPESLLGISGKKILSATEVTLPEGLPLTLDMLQNNGGNLSQCYDAFIAKVESEVEKYLPSGITGAEFADEFCLMASYRALAGIGGATKITSAYIDLCANITGAKSGKTKPLDEYYTMLANTYNFASETEAQRYAARMYLSETVIRGGFIAAMAATLIGDESVQSNVDKAYQSANSEIENNTGDHAVVPNIEQYCYIISRNIIGITILAHDGVNPAAYLNSAQCRIMQNRYLRLKASGSTSSPTFSAYLQSNFGINQAFRLVSGQQIKRGVGSDVYGGWNLQCYSSYVTDGAFGNGWDHPAYTVGKSYQIGLYNGNIGDSFITVYESNWRDTYQCENQDALSGQPIVTHRHANNDYYCIYGWCHSGFSYYDNYPVLLYLSIQ